MAAGAHTQRSLSAGQASFMATAPARDVAQAALSAESDRFHPLPWHPAPARPAGGPHEELLVPHPSHAYHPAASYFGPGRGHNVNVLQTGPTGGAGITHERERTPLVATHLAARYASPQRSGASATSSPPFPRAHQPPAPRGGLSTTRELESKFQSAQVEYPATLPRRHSPVRVAHSTSHDGAPPSGSGVIPTVGVGGAVASQLHSSARPSPPTFQSSFDSTHPVSGSSAVAVSQAIPSTDAFIDQLRRRLQQTNELLGTARKTQLQHEAQEYQAQ